VSTGKTLHLIKAHQGRIHSASFSPDSRVLASIGIDNLICLWDASTGRKISTMPGHYGDVNTISFSGDGKSLISSGNDGSVRLWSVSSGKPIVSFTKFQDEWVAKTPEGYFSGSRGFSKYMHYVKRFQTIDFNQLYDVFYRPDIVQMKVLGENISSLATLTVEEALNNPPPVVKIFDPPEKTRDKSIRIRYKVTSTGGGIGEIRLFHNGKLIQSDGYYKDLARMDMGKSLKLTSLNSDVITRQLRGLAIARERRDHIYTGKKGNIVQGDILIELISGDNEIGIAAFNETNTVQSELKTARIVANIPTEEPHMYILVIGIDRYRDANSNLRYAAKDAQDILKHLSSRVTTVFNKRNIHTRNLYNEEATKEGIMNVLRDIASRIKATDSFILFVASHGVLNHGIYSIVTHDYSGYLQDSSLVNSGTIMDSSKNIRALNQLLIFDTCHAGGIDNLFSGLYDARMTVLAKRMGLHMYASASTKQEAIDGYRGNGLFTYALIDGLKNNADINSDRKVTIKELGNYSRDLTLQISSKIGYKQTPLTVYFGKDNTLFWLK